MPKAKNKPKKEKKEKKIFIFENQNQIKEKVICIKWDFSYFMRGYSKHGNKLYSEHVHAKLIKADKCLFVLRCLRKEAFSQDEVDRLFSSLVLPNFTYGLSVYGAVDSDLMVIQNFLFRCFKRKYISKRMDIRNLLEKADSKLFKICSADSDCPLSKIIPKKEETENQLRNRTANCPKINSNRFKNVFVNRLIFKYNV